MLNQKIKKIGKKVSFIADRILTGTLWKQNELEWAIGIYTGKSPFDLTSESIKNPVLTRKDVSDVPADFVADPFMIRANGIWYMFFEVLNLQSRRGEIGLASSENGIKWKYQKIVLAEPYHLSYPYVFEWMNEYYMIPESYEANSIRLYKASTFPTEWSFVGNLIGEGFYLDPSLFRYNDKWWLFAETNFNHKYDTLSLYYADDLMGSWQEHPHSPIIKGNARIARPGGRVFVVDGKLIRCTQNCYIDYGTQLQMFEIEELTTTSYSEREIDKNPILTASGSGWNASGMHHIDPHILEDGRWIACVDGR